MRGASGLGDDAGNYGNFPLESVNWENLDFFMLWPHARDRWCLTKFYGWLVPLALPLGSGIGGQAMGPGKPLDSAHCGEDNGASQAAEQHLCWTQQERYKAKGPVSVQSAPASPTGPALGDLFFPVSFYVPKQEEELGLADFEKAKKARQWQRTWETSQTSSSSASRHGQMCIGQRTNSKTASSI